VPRVKSMPDEQRQYDRDDGTRDRLAVGVEHDAFAREGTSMRLLSAMLVVAALLGGCAGWSQTPYNARAACNAAGGYFTADGRCLAGNS